MQRIGRCETEPAHAKATARQKEEQNMSEIRVERVQNEQTQQRACHGMYGCGSSECMNLSCPSGCRNNGGHHFFPVFGVTCRKCGYPKYDDYVAPF